MKNEMMKLGGINTWERLGQLLGYVGDKEFKKDIAVFAEEMYEENILDEFCDKQKDYVNSKLFNMNPEFLIFNVYRKTLSYLLEKELGVESITKLFGELDLVFKEADDCVYIINKRNYEDENCLDQICI